MKARHARTPVTIFFCLCFIIPWESDRRKRRLVCQIRRLSNKCLKLPLCKQHIKARFFPCTLSSWAKNLPCISLCLSCLHSLTRLFSPQPAASLSSLALSGLWSSTCCLFEAQLLPSLVQQLANTMPPAPLPPLTHCCDAQLRPPPQSLLFTIHHVFAFSAPKPLGCLVRGDEKEGEEIMVCLRRAKQTDWQMGSPSDAAQR